MLRLPTFTYHRPRTVADAVALAAEHGSAARFVAGGTDLYPNMKRGVQVVREVISLAQIEELHDIVGNGADGSMRIGALTTLREVENSALIKEQYPAFAAAVALISSPLLRNMGTIGGNLLIDTRCGYYNQTEEWRESISFCMKESGDLCWTAPGSPKCLAVQSSDSVPLLCAMGAEVSLVSAEGERRVALDDLYRNDGIDYLTKQPGELLTHLHLPQTGGWRASYRKLRRRGSIDFPILGVGACLHMDGETIVDAKVRLGGLGSMPIAAVKTEDALRGQKATPELLEEAAALAYKPAKAMENTDSEAGYRKKLAPIYVRRALADCLD